MCEKINSFNFLKSLFLKQRRQKIIYFRHIETEESMITKKKNYPTILIRIWTIIRPQIFFWIVSLTNIGTTERWKIKEKDHFQFSFPPPSPLRYLIAAEFPRKMSEGTRYGFESSAKKFLSPGGLTGPASDAGASVATGMSRNARRTVTPTSIARCCTAWHGARDNHRPGREGRKGRERQRERERELV